MLQPPSLVQEATSRAKDLHLERVIKSLGAHEDVRRASPRQVKQRHRTLLRQVRDTAAADLRLERILQGNELSDVSYLALGTIAARAICRIVIRHDQRLLGHGTGFLVAPGVLLTNHHVLPSETIARDSIAQFRYERNVRGQELDPVEFDLVDSPSPILFRDLDIALVGVRPRSRSGQALEQFGWLRLDPRPGKAFVGEYLTIIQHPNGERKQVCVRENKLLKFAPNGPYLWYQTDTVGGSSGSPVFNNSWQVVALHHSSVPRTKRVGGRDVWLAKDGRPWTEDMGDDAVDWMANEGVRISRIYEYLASEHPDHPLARAALATDREPPLDERLTATPDGADLGIQVHSDGNGGTRIRLPIEIAVNVGLEKGAYDVAVAGAPPSAHAEPPPRGRPTLEKVEINQDDYPDRNGYDPNFLGNGFPVPRPRITSSRFGKALTVQGRQAIDYWNYTVVMNRARALAFYSAANVNAAKFRGNRDGEGDTWYRDTRVDQADDEAQLGKEFYKKQKTFEADRTKNPFDQGHLTRRRDLQWGSDDGEAKRNGDDSYHYTNCAPQHWQFNQNNRASGIWFRLEEMALHLAGARSKLCVINGPIFDAPLGIPGASGTLRLDVRGKRSPDGTFGGVKIPKQFFKVVAYRSEGELRASAFVVTQEDLLATIDRYYPSERSAPLTSEEVRLYQVRLADLERLTGLDFGSLASHDVSAEEGALPVLDGLPIESEDEIVF